MFARRIGIRLIGVFGAAAALAAADMLPAQLAPAEAAYPFTAGETAVFQVKLGGVSVGRGSMRLLGVEEVRGHPTYHARMEISGGVPLARVNDRYDSWIDTEGLFSRRFHQNIHEVQYRANRQYEFFPEQGSWRRTDNGETGSLPTAQPLDDISFLYYARTLPLKVGETYTLRRYFKESGNPVVLKVLRKETIRVPAGTFNTIVVQPVIQSKGLFGEGGRAEVYFSDDERRVPVQITSRVPVVGSLNMYLQQYVPGAVSGIAPLR